jgi:hypothetical protein
MVPMTAQIQNPPTEIASAPCPVPGMLPSALAQPVPGITQGVNEVRPYWGDRLFFLFCLGCVVLIILMNGYDLLKGLLGD